MHGVSTWPVGVNSLTWRMGLDVVWLCGRQWENMTFREGEPAVRMENQLETAMAMEDETEK